MRILVTGGCGFIGTHLCELLSQHQLDATVIDLLSPKIPIKNIKYVSANILQQAKLKSVLSNIDFVFHLAANASVPNCQADPLNSFESNTTGTLMLLEAIRAANELRNKPIKIVFASSSAVYGNCDGVKSALSESLPLHAPLSLYALQKRCSEQLLELYFNIYNIPSISLRFFNVYGPGQNPNSNYSGVITLFKKAIDEGRELKIFGDGHQTRDFIHVDDVVSALMATLTVNPNELKANPVNLGLGHGTSIRELAQLMLNICNKQNKLKFHESRVGDLSHSIASIERAKSILGWNPQIPLELGLKGLLSRQTLKKVA